MALPYLFVRWLKVPFDVYSFIFLACSVMFVAAYRKYSSFEIRSSLKTGWALGFVLALFVGSGFVSIALSESLKFADFVNRLSRPVTLWRGITFGLAAGVMISTLPFVVVWRSLAGDNPGKLRKMGVTILAAISIAFLSFCHNIGLTGYRGIDSQVRRNMIAGLPTLLSGNPLAAMVAGTFMAVSDAAKSEETPVGEPMRKTIIANKPGQAGGAN